MTEKLNFLFCATREKDTLKLELLIDSLCKYHTFNYQVYTRANLLKSLTFIKRENIVTINDSKTSSFLDKTYAINNCKFEKFIFLDCDTFLLDNIQDLWLLTDKHNVCVAHAPRRYTLKFKSVPDIFPEFNTGVISIKRTEQVNTFLKNWHLIFSRHVEDEGFPSSKDQPFFRKCLYESNINFFTLTSEYNCRFKMGVNVCNNVKILHGYINDIDIVVKSINSTDEHKLSQYSDEADLRFVKY